MASGLERLSIVARLAEIEERDALADAAANDGLWDFNFDTNELYLSPRWKAMLGYEDNRATGVIDWRGLVHPDDLSRVQDAIQKHVSGAAPIFDSVHTHAPLQWRVSLGDQSRQGQDRQAGTIAAAGGRGTGHHRTQALRGGAVPGKGKRADHAAIDR